MPAIGIIASAAVTAGIVLWRRYGPRTYLRFNTLFGRARIYEVQDDRGAPVRLLEVGGIVQSGTYVDDDRCYGLVFEYLKKYDIIFSGEHRIRNVAVLGCGGYDYPEHLIAHHPEVMVDAVEIDPAITAIARQWFFLDRLVEEFETDKTKRLDLITADALEFLTNRQYGGKPAYDAIVNDCFDAGEAPAHLTTSTFAKAVRARLSPGGIYLTNIVASPAFLEEQVSLLESVFAYVKAYPCSPDYLTEPDNVIVAASDSALPAASH